MQIVSLSEHKNSTGTNWTIQLASQLPTDPTEAPLVLKATERLEGPFIRRRPKDRTPETIGACAHYLRVRGFFEPQPYWRLPFGGRFFVGPQRSRIGPSLVSRSP
jgi:hypothetical protein